MSDIRTTIKAHFETDDFPTQAEFAQWVDAMVVLGGASNLMADNQRLSNAGGALSIGFLDSADEIQILDFTTGYGLGIGLDYFFYGNANTDFDITPEGYFNMDVVRWGCFGATPVDQPTGIPELTDTAGALYDATAQGLINDLRDNVNLLRTALQNLGIITTV